MHSDGEDGNLSHKQDVLLRGWQCFHLEDPGMVGFEVVLLGQYLSQVIRKFSSGASSSSSALTSDRSIAILSRSS